MSPFTAYTVPLKKSTIRFACVESILCRLITTARLFNILSAISWTSLYDFGSYNTTFDEGCWMADKLTTFLFLVCFGSKARVSSAGTSTSSSTYSYSSSVLKKFLNLSLKLIIITSNRLLNRLTLSQSEYELHLLQLQYRNHYSYPSIVVYKEHGVIFHLLSYLSIAPIV